MIEGASFFVGCERGTAVAEPAIDVDAPLDEHATHRFVGVGESPRWRECSVCGVRDYWRAATRQCAARAPDAAISLDYACAAIIEDVGEFFDWWLRKGLETGRPSMPEWRAEFFEWARTPR